MVNVAEVANKVQRMLAGRFGSVRVDKDGDFVVQFESAVVFVRAKQWHDDNTLVSIKCPLIVDAPITPELTRWVATEGQMYFFGHTWLNPSEDGKTGWIYFEHTLLGDDLDESELMTALDAVVLTSNELDNELLSKFGGKLFGPDK